LSKKCQKVVKVVNKFLKSCQINVKKLSKSWSKSCQKVVKNNLKRVGGEEGEEEGGEGDL
jgi:hypothetical protein